MFKLDYVKNNKQVKAYIAETEKYIDFLGYTDHGFAHVNLVSERARYLAKKLNLSEKEEELSAIAAYCHDMGNFLGRSQHHYWGAILFNQIFANDKNVDIDDVIIVSQAIADHDKNENKLISAVAAILVIADKSDVSRKRIKDLDKIDFSNIHNRVNYYVLNSKLQVFNKRKIIRLSLTVDDSLSIMEYFEIFSERMSYCRIAAKFLNYSFQLQINNFILK